MKQFTLRMNKAYQRPIIELKTWYGLEALLDTGALFPIWTADEKNLTKDQKRGMLNLGVLAEKQPEICIGWIILLLET